MALTTEEQNLLALHEQNLGKTRKDDEKHLKYYRARQELEQLGLGIPEPMQRFLVIANWCRVLVDTKDDRMRVRSVLLPGEETENDEMRAMLNASRIDTQLSRANKDRMIYGRCYFSIGKIREDGPSVIRASSPLQMTTIIDPLTELESSAARFYKLADDTDAATLYLPEETIHLIKDKSGWVENPELGRDHHNLGYVPVVTHYNRAVTGEFQGETELSDIIPLVDSVARALTNMQFAQESHGAPHRYITGITTDDMLDSMGRKRTTLEAYFNAITILAKEGAKMGQLPAADLKNFSEALNTYATQAAAVTALPMSYWGVSTANPQSEGAIIADESRFVHDVKSDNALMGETLGRAAEIAWLDSTGQELDWTPTVEWYDPATQTVAQLEDALSKRRAQGVLSKRGYMTALGMSKTAIDQEMKWLAEEAESEAQTNPISRFARSVTTGRGFDTSTGQPMNIGGLELTAGGSR